MLCVLLVIQNNDRSSGVSLFYLVLLEKSHNVYNILGQLLGVHGGGHHLSDDAAVIDDNDTIQASLLLGVKKIKGCRQGACLVTPEGSGEGPSKV